MLRSQASFRASAFEDDKDDETPVSVKLLMRLSLLVDRWQSVVHRKNEKSEEQAKMETLATVIRAFRDPAEEEDTEVGKAWVDKARFDIVVTILILLNTLVISLETDYGGRTGKREALWIILEAVFCAFSVLEISLKLYYHSWRWIFTYFGHFVTFCIGFLLVLNLCAISLVTPNGQLRLVSLLRLVQLVLLHRLVKLDRSLEEFRLVIQGLLDSFRALAWTLALAIIFVYIWAVFLTRQIGHNMAVYGNYKKLSGGWDPEEFFGTVGRSMFTLFQCMTLDGWSSEVARHVVNNQVSMVLFFLPFLLLTTFGLLNVIVAILVETMLAAAATNNSKLRVRQETARIRELQSIRDIFLISDSDCNGTLDLNEFLLAVQKPEVQWRMRQLELPAADAAKLFGVIGNEGSRTLTLDEFIKGCTKLKGTAQSRDMLAVQAQADAVTRKMDMLGESMNEAERLMNALDEVSLRMSQRFDSVVDDARRKIALHVGGSKPMVPPKRDMPDTGKAPLSIGNRPALPLYPDLL